MGIKAALSKPFASLVISGIKKRYENPVKLQQDVFAELMQGAASTRFGKDHGLVEGFNPTEYASAVPLRDYEDLKPYISRILQGEKDVLWPGQPIYLCKTSGTTSGAKYIPLTRESMPNHIQSARNALLSYIAETGNASFVDGKMIFLQGSPVLEMHRESGIPLGRLSGIVANHVPAYLQKNRLPSYTTNCIEDWESKVDQIVEETLREDMRLISGIPSWVQMYFEKLIERSGRSSIQEIFPNFSLFVYGGVNYEPYRNRFERLIGQTIPSIELYPASEGFLAWQDSQEEDGLLLVLDQGIYYEFVPADQYFEENPPRLSLADVQIGVNYAVVLSTNAGLWGYSIGDTVKFVSLNPPRIKVTGRIKHFTSAFGEHVIAEEVEAAMDEALAEYPAEVAEFTVAPQVEPAEGLPYHEWCIEFAASPGDLNAFAHRLDSALQERNPYYKDLIKGHVLRPLVITPLPRNAFHAYMKSEGKLGGQNKVPRLSNDRKIADFFRQLQA